MDEGAIEGEGEENVCCCGIPVGLFAIMERRKGLVVCCGLSICAGCCCGGGDWKLAMPSCGIAPRFPGWNDCCGV